MVKATMSRIPLSLRTLVLLPLLAAGVDLTRATVACGAQAQTCLEAAGRGWLGPAAALLIVAFGLLTAWRLLRHVPASPAPFGRLWALGTVGVTIACTGQSALAHALGGNEAVLGGSPAGVLALCVAAGALLALVLRISDSDEPLRAPRPRSRPRVAWLYVRPGSDPVRPGRRRGPRGRAPPSL